MTVYTDHKQKTYHIVERVLEVDGDWCAHEAEILDALYRVLIKPCPTPYRMTERREAPYRDCTVCTQVGRARELDFM